jgi:hypothetical protein
VYWVTVTLSAVVQFMLIHSYIHWGFAG